MKRIALLTSGGDAPGMNACIRAVVRSAIACDIEVVGVRDGYKGLVGGNFEELPRQAVSRIINRGGTILGSARFEEFKKDTAQEQAIQKMKERSIDALVAVGGEGTFRGARALAEKGVLVNCIPATIDNDIYASDYAIGFFTAVDTAVQSIDKLRDTSDSHQRCSVVEVMGRGDGDIALFAGIATGADIVVTPETGFDRHEVIKSVNEAFAKNKRHAIVIITENITDVSRLAESIEKDTAFETRATVLGHVQRGGTPVAFDRFLAARMGQKAVTLLQEGTYNRVLAFRENTIIDYGLKEALSAQKESRQELLELVTQFRH